MLPREIMQRLWPRDRLTVRQQFALATGALCLLMVATLAVSTTLLGRNATDRLVRQEVAELADTMMDNLQRGMFERFRELRLLARLHVLSDLLKDDGDKLQALLEHMQATVPDYAWIGLAQPDGEVKVATGDMLEGQSVAHHDWFASGLKGPALADVAHAHMVSSLPVVMDNAPARLVSLSTPVLAGDGALIGVLGAHVDWSWADRLRREFLTPKNDRAATDIWIVSRNGKILLGGDHGRQAFTPDQLAAMKAAGSGAFVDYGSGSAVLTGFAIDRGYRDYPGLGWIVVARRSAAAAFAPVHQLVLALAGLGVVFAIGGVVLAGVAARRVAAPIQELTKAAGRIGHDPDFRTFPVVRGVQEVVQLSSVLRLLLHRIGFAEQQMVDSEQRAEEERQRLAENIDSLRHLAETDPLTGLLNRRALLGHCKHAAEGSKQRIAVLMIDIDHFKSINDRYGHSVGDDVIRAAANAIAANIRAGDKVARFGGEEFIVLLTDIDEANLTAQAERIRAAVEQMQVPSTTEGINVTVSCGGAVTNDGDRDLHGLIARADIALYTAKNEGRNRVRLAPPKSAGQAAA